jgi:hypothetical protein
MAAIGECSYIFNPGNATQSCVAGGITGTQFTDTDGCIWCATTTSQGNITTTLISCPSANPAILMEDGTYILIEDGTKILTQ